MGLDAYVGTEPRLTLERAEWREHAACRGETALFFAPAHEWPVDRRRREDRARALCGRCPVAAECRAFAREHREYGVWGGKSEEDRARAGFAPLQDRTRRVRSALHEREEASA